MDPPRKREPSLAVGCCTRPTPRLSIPSVACLCLCYNIFLSPVTWTDGRPNCLCLAKERYCTRATVQFVTWICYTCTPPIIGAMVIVWGVRGEIIRSVLCNIVCNNCAQRNAHTYEHWTDLTVLWIGFCLTGPISLCVDSFLCMYYLYLTVYCMHV